MRTKSPPSNDLYAGARRTLEQAIRDPNKFAQAVALATRYCEVVRAHEWSEIEIRQRGREAMKSWDSANVAALKLAEHFETLDPLTGYVRLAEAWNQVAGSGTKKMPPPPTGATFAKLLHALARQVLRTPRKRPVGHGYVLGPLGVGRSSRRMPSRGVALTVALAHVFGRVLAYKGSGPLINNGEAIKSGRAWEAAADFSMAALDCVVDANAAKKYLRDHRGHLYLRLWPKPRKRPAKTHRRGPK